MNRDIVLWAAPMRKSNVALAICLLLQGCALVQNQQAIDASSLLIGRRRAAIMECAGIPEQVEKAGGKEIDIYWGTARHLASGVVLGEANCNVSIVFEADRVVAVNYTAVDPGILAPLESCADIVAACLP
ncbi:MAG TPA: hypothetical protein VMU78_06720 [Methylocella sp.]|nr:hypothetical protein [Methylocella sp.]